MLWQREGYGTQKETEVIITLEFPKLSKTLLQCQLYLIFFYTFCRPLLSLFEINPSPQGREKIISLD